MTDVSVSNLFGFYNSVIGFSSPGVFIYLTRFEYSNVSICGSLMTTYSAFPLRSQIRYSLLQSVFDANVASQSEFDSFIHINNSTFTNLGLTISYEAGLQATSFGTSSYDRMSSILNVDNFPGEIVISDSSFSGSKLLLDFTLPFDPSLETPLD